MERVDFDEEFDFDDDILEEYKEVLPENFFPAQVRFTMKSGPGGSRSLRLSHQKGNDFFRPYTGEKPKNLYFSVRLLKNKYYLFIDEHQPDNEGLVPFKKRNPKRPLYTHCTIRKISLDKTNYTYSVSVPRQVIGLMPELLYAKNLRAERVYVKDNEESVRWKVII